MPQYTFALRIDAADTEAFYQGRKTWVQVHSEQGVKIRLPWTRFRPWISRQGLQGRFALTLGPDHQFIKLESLYE